MKPRIEQAEESTKRTILIGIAAALGTLLLAGCETTTVDAPAPAARPQPAAAAQDDEVLIPAAKVNAIAKGMTAAQVEELLGQPTRKSPFAAGGVKAEVWKYRISARETVARIAVEMRDVPTFDPLTGRMIDHKEPVYQNQHTRLYRTLELLMVDGRLTERKPGTDVERFFQ